MNCFTVTGFLTTNNRSLSASVELHIIEGRSGLNARFSGLSAPKTYDRKTYIEAKICVILRRDFGVNISESSTDRIMTRLRFPRSRSTLRCKKKRRFNEHYSEIGKDAQIDHMTVPKNELSLLSNMFLQPLIAKQIALMLLNFYEN